MLNAEEESFNEGLEIKDSIFALAASANQKSNGSGYNQNHNRGRGKGGRGSNGQSSQFSPFNHFQQGQYNSGGARSDRLICQIYGKLGHLAVNCYHKMDYAYQGKHPPAKLVAMATTSNAYFTQD